MLLLVTLARDDISSSVIPFLSLFLFGFSFLFEILLVGLKCMHQFRKTNQYLVQAAFQQGYRFNVLIFGPNSNMFTLFDLLM